MSTLMTLCTMERQLKGLALPDTSRKKDVGHDEGLFQS